MGWHACLSHNAYTRSSPFTLACKPELGRSTSIYRGAASPRAHLRLAYQPCARACVHRTWICPKPLSGFILAVLPAIPMGHHDGRLLPLLCHSRVISCYLPLAQFHYLTMLHVSIHSRLTPCLFDNPLSLTHWKGPLFSSCSPFTLFGAGFMDKSFPTV